MGELSIEPCVNCGWPSQIGSPYCETCDEAPYENEERPWYVPYIDGESQWKVDR